MSEQALHDIKKIRTRTRTRTNTNPNDTEANAAGRSGNARALRKQSKCGVIHEGKGHWPSFSQKIQDSHMTLHVRNGLRPPFFALYYPHYRFIFVYPLLQRRACRGSVSTVDERKQCSIIVYGDLLRNATITIGFFVGLATLLVSP